MNLFKKPFANIKLTVGVIISSSCLLIAPFYYSKDDGRIADKYELVNNTENAPDFKNVGIDAILPSCEPYKEFTEELSFLKIRISQSRQWYKNILRAHNTPTRIIGEFNRNRFKSKLFLGDSQCPLKASIRISGDFKDHLGMQEGVPVASMDVNLKDGNVRGVTKFKLFLPKTRNGINEVFTSNLFSYLGLLAPRTSLLMVDINNVTHPYIFQEKAAKEFIEFRSNRESAMFKFNESLMWKLRQNINTTDFFNSLISPVVINSKWASMNRTSSYITNSGLNQISAEFDKVHRGQIHGDFPLSEKNLSGNSTKAKKIQSLFMILSLITRADHGLTVNHNRRFYYDPFLNQLQPIYYDGNSRMLALDRTFSPDSSFFDYLSQNSKVIQSLEKNISFLDFDHAQKAISSINVIEFQAVLNYNGAKLKYKDVMSLKNELLSNLAVLQSFSKEYILKQNNFNGLRYSNEISPQPTNRPDYDAIVPEIGSVYLLGSNKAVACHPAVEKCFTFNATNAQLRDIYKGLFFYDGLSYKYSNSNVNAIFSTSFPPYKANAIQFKDTVLPDFSIRTYGNPEISTNLTDKSINFSLNNKNDKIVIYNGIVDGWTIRGRSSLQSSQDISPARYDSHLLTSSLTIQDAKVKDLDINFVGGMLEDSINFVRSTGNVASITVSNSYQDALDIDFSDLIIDSILINNSGNDCIDFSSGNYEVKTSTLINCADKAISIGEKSKAIFDSVYVRNSNVALVSKDSSDLRINNADIKNSLLCIAVYRKKQEFYGAKIVIPKGICNKNDIFIQMNSQITFK